MTRSEFMDWKADPRTKEVWQIYRNQIRDIAFDLALSAGSDSSEDRLKVGIVKGLQMAMDLEFEEEQKDA